MPGSFGLHPPKRGMTRAAAWKTSFFSVPPAEGVRGCACHCEQWLRLSACTDLHMAVRRTRRTASFLCQISVACANGNVRGRLAEVKTGSARARVQCHKTKGGEKMAKRENVLEKLIGKTKRPEGAGSHRSPSA